MGYHPRDSQRSKLYNAESMARQMMPSNKMKLFTTKLQVTRFVEKVTNSTWWDKNWGKLPGGVEIAFPNTYRKCAYARGDWMISLPRWAWNTGTILHELAHIVNSRHMQQHDRVSSDAAHHGPEYCHRLLRFYRRWCGREAWETLKSVFKAKKVKHQMPRKRRSGTVHPNSLKNLRPKKATGGSPVVKKETFKGLQAKVLDYGIELRWGHRKSVDVFVGNFMAFGGKLSEAVEHVNVFVAKNREELSGFRQKYQDDLISSTRARDLAHELSDLFWNRS